MGCFLSGCADQTAFCGLVIGQADEFVADNVVREPEVPVKFVDERTGLGDDLKYSLWFCRGRAVDFTAGLSKRNTIPVRRDRTSWDQPLTRV